MALLRNSKVQATSNMATFNTLSFSNEVYPPRITEKGTTEQGSAILSGFYFEACVVDSLNTVFQTSKKIEYDGNQKRAIEVFNSSAADASTKKFKLAIELAAKAATKNLKDQIDRKLKNTTEKNYEISNIATKAGGGGQLLGDIEIIVNGERIILELKWQNKKNTPTKWFGLSDKTLFGKQTFANFLSQKVNAANFWSHTLISADWSTKLETEGLVTFLSKIGLSKSSAAIKFFLNKGYGIKQVDKAAAKFVVHGSFVGATITNLDSLKLDMQSNITGTAFDTLHNHVSRRALVYTDENGQEVASFGISNYKSAYHRNLESKNRIPISEEAFSFEMYFAQKFINRVMEA